MAENQVHLLMYVSLYVLSNVMCMVYTPEEMCIKKWVSSGHLTDPSRTTTKSGNSLEAEGTWAMFGHQPSHFLLPQIHFSPFSSLSSFCHRSWEHTCMHVHTHTYKHTCQALCIHCRWQVRKSTNGYPWEGSPMAGVDHLSNTCPSRPGT